MNCNYCGQPKPKKQVGNDWYHEKCWGTMPPNRVFPKEFRRITAQEQFDKMIKPYVKDGKFKL